jgi:predicted HicB family RNase H-like nuclease
MDNKSAIVNFRLTPAQHKKLRQYAKNQAVSITEAILNSIQHIIGTR